MSSRAHWLERCIGSYTRLLGNVARGILVQQQQQQLGHASTARATSSLVSRLTRPNSRIATLVRTSYSPYSTKNPDAPRPTGAVSVTRPLKHKNKTVMDISMRTPLPGHVVNTQAHQAWTRSGAETEVTTLPNGLQVASVETGAPTGAVGLLVKTGSSLEPPEFRGCSIMLEKLSFKTCSDISASELVNDIEQRGANAMAASSRDSLVYACEGLRGDLPALLKAISKTALHPVFSPDDVELAKQLLLYSIEDNDKNPDMYLGEAIHATAFGAESALGRPLLPRPEALDSITIEQLHKFHSLFFVPNNMVLAGCGIEHRLLVEMAHEHFGALRPGVARTWSSSPYVGGFAFVPDQRPPPLVQRLDEVHTAIGLRGPPLFDRLTSRAPEDFYVACLLQAMMGGGSSFSAGGPGKGMYSRLYRQVLNEYGWFENISCSNFSYPEDSIFLIQAAANQKPRTFDLLDITASMLKEMESDISTEEFERARNQLKSQVLACLESRLPLLEDILFSIRIYNQRVPGESHIQRLDALTPDHIIQYARKMLQSEPTIVVHESADQQKNWVGDSLLTALRGVLRAPRRTAE